MPSLAVEFNRTLASKPSDEINSATRAGDISSGRYLTSALPDIKPTRILTTPSSLPVVLRNNKIRLTNQYKFNYFYFYSRTIHIQYHISTKS